MNNPTDELVNKLFAEIARSYDEQTVWQVCTKVKQLISNREKLLLDLYQKDMQGYDFTPADYEGGEDTNALVADALKNSREYVEATLRKELNREEPTHE